ncbi:hypothetical protein DCAR_0832625 [Daucus carota subsp. sativus]|uniref:Uncharacterized protein n=1 Tax=Daucus carota subsp. sativus TaxID=79200 RepID=A0A175YQX4_DAUCS|nr:hypothetical protein DCAR_0832625 [Daucus carota subsp. sativus]
MKSNKDKKEDEMLDKMPQSPGDKLKALCHIGFDWRSPATTIGVAVNITLPKNVAKNHLEGPIPDNLSSCTNLNSFNVFWNKLNGAIPSAFERLESMTYLNLKGPIPIELSRIGNLDKLDLSHTNLSGAIPEELSQLQNIFSLQVSLV